MTWPMRRCCTIRQQIVFGCHCVPDEFCPLPAGAFHALHCYFVPACALIMCDPCSGEYVGYNDIVQEDFGIALAKFKKTNGVDHGKKSKLGDTKLEFTDLIVVKVNAHFVDGISSC